MVRVSEYNAACKREWDEFVRGAKNGHFMFHRDYMDYHADRFPDASLMFHDERDNLIGLLPATGSGDVLSSHAGLSFGGVISDRNMKAAMMIDLFAAMCATARQRGARELIYKPVPHIYHQLPAEEDLYALFRLGARLIRRDVSSAIDRDARLPLSKGRNWALRQAGKSGVTVEPSMDLPAFMAIEEDVLKTRHNTKPVHSAAELELLASRFPDNIKLFVARRDAQMLAGVVVYDSARVVHTQYIGTGEEGRKVGALDLILEHLITEHYADRKYFDFGISNEDDGRFLNTGLIQNKESYGARAVVFDRYSIDLTAPDPA